MIRSPAPGVVAEPGPPVIVRPSPAAISIGCPADGNRGLPDHAVRSDVHPLAMAVQRLGAGDIAVDVVVGSAAHQLLVAPVVPLIPFVIGNVRHAAKLRVAGGSANLHRPSGLEPLGTLRRVDLRFPAPDRNFCDQAVGILPNRHPVHALFEWPNRNAGSRNVDVGIRLPDDGEHDCPARQLNLITVVVQLSHPELGIGGQPDQVGPVELNLRARAGAGQDSVSGKQRAIDRRRHPLAGVSALHRHVARNEAEPGDALAGSVLFLRQSGRRQEYHRPQDLFHRAHPSICGHLDNHSELSSYQPITNRSSNLQWLKTTTPGLQRPAEIRLGKN